MCSKQKCEDCITPGIGCKSHCDPKKCETCDGDGHCLVCNGDPNQGCCKGKCYDRDANETCCGEKEVYNTDTQKCCGNGALDVTICDINEQCCQSNCCDFDANEVCCDNINCYDLDTKQCCHRGDGSTCNWRNCEDCNSNGSGCILWCEPNHPCNGNGHCVSLIVISPGQNIRISFDSNSPGTLKIIITINSSCPINPGDISIQCDGAGSSTMTIGPITIDADGNYVITITFTSLPEHNSDFGVKNAKIYYKGTLMGTLTFKMFFPKNGTNHPGAGSGTTPNWYFYWSQTGASSGSHQYNSGCGYDGQYTCGDSNFEIGPSANGSDYGYYVSGDGIDNLGATCLHEKAHMDYFLNTWGTWANYLSQRATEDKYGDLMKDSDEPALGYDPSKNGTPTNTYCTSDDNEDYACRAESGWKNGSQNSNDWSSPGHQSN